jgi:hypothetical protein
VVFWYGLVPVAGAQISRYKWWQFRRRFDELRLRPLLDYSLYRQIGVTAAGGVFRFTGGFESVTDGRTLWIQGENLTIPVSLANAQTWLLPVQERGETPESFDPGEETPERIRWDRLSTLTEGAKVFVGGALVFQDERWCFVSTRETPLMVIFYDCPDTALTARVIRAGRSGTDYWNQVTPYALVIGALCLLYIAISFLPRPAFRLTVITALIGLFTPLLPMIPPGLLLTVLSRYLAWRARILRACRDLSRLPLRYLPPDRAGGQGGENAPFPAGQPPGGEPYGCARYDSLPAAALEGELPFVLPGYSKKGTDAEWYAFGTLRPGQDRPSRPADPFVTFGILPGKPEDLARRYSIFAYTLEIISWITLLTGIGLNILFILVILTLL